MRRLAKNSMVRPLKICDHEVDELGAEVVECTKLDRKCYLAERYGALTW